MNSRHRLVLSALLVVATSTWADRVRAMVVVVPIDEGARPRAEALSAALAPQLRRNEERVELVTLDGLVEPMETQRRLKATERGLELLRKAEQERGSFGAALDSFDQGDWRESQDAAIEALARSAIDEKSESKLIKLFTVRPEYRFSPLTPELDALIQAQREAKDAAPQVEFSITSPVPAVVWLDGVLLGATPQSPRTRGGRHRVTALSRGRALIQSEYLIEAGTRITLSFADTAAGPSLRAALDEVSAGFRTGEYLIPIWRLRDVTKTPEVVVIGVGSTGTGRVVRMNEQAQSSTSPLPDSDVESILRAVRVLYDRAIGVTLTAAGEPSLGPTKRSWSYISLTTGAGFALVGAVLMLVAGGQLQAAQQIPQTNQVAFDRAVGEARAVQGVGIGGLVLGSVGIGLGTWLLFTSEPNPTKPSVVSDQY